ncbi:MAG: phosphoribosylformylglycinamidine cyclo-ligase [Bacteriovoracaceae bacterium]|nr:phosphoribosylformylglycinamidine cyclo-ligase [Bacteriovoracaceae bacterium]
MSTLTYKDSGVDVQKGEELVSRIKKKVRSTYGERVYDGVGGFASLYKITDEKLIAAGTDGVGTKLELAQKLGVHNSIGIDLVAMCVNDILCTGATPLFFMDYFACGKLDLDISESVIDGIIEGCRQSKMALVGGETAEMPGMYKEGDYDLAGFAIGEVEAKKLIDGSKIAPDNTIIGISSSGFHSNGFSLIRQLLEPHEKNLMMEALTPTRIYADTLTKLQQVCPDEIFGVAHITGGGFTNIARLSNKVDYVIDRVPELNEIPGIFRTLRDRSKISQEELYRTFNMGVGLVLITPSPEEVYNILSDIGEKFWILGKTVKGSGKVVLDNNIL